MFSESFEPISNKFNAIKEGKDTLIFTIWSPSGKLNNYHKSIIEQSLISNLNIIVVVNKPFLEESKLIIFLIK